MNERPPKGDRLYVILHNIRSAYNVGAILRSADAFGVDKVFLGGYTPTPDRHAAVAKTALGAEQSVPWEKHWHTYRLIDQLKKEGVRIVALEQTAHSQLLDRYTPHFPMALMLGNEVTGVSKNMLARADEAIEIPMRGRKESLNVSVAFGIAGYMISRNKQ